MTTLKEYRRSRAAKVLDCIRDEYPEHQPHANPVKALSGTDSGISKPGVRFCLPEDSAINYSDFDRVT